MVVKPYRIKFVNPRKYVKVFGHNLDDAKYEAVEIYRRNASDIEETHEIKGWING